MPRELRVARLFDHLSQWVSIFSLLFSDIVFSFFFFTSLVAEGHTLYLGSSHQDRRFVSHRISFPELSFDNFKILTRERPAFVMSSVENKEPLREMLKHVFQSRLKFEFRRLVIIN